MTTALKTYLIAHLLPGLANATASRDEYAERERETTDPLDAEYCRNMRKHYQSQVEVWQKNVDEAREMLEEEEPTAHATCEHKWVPSYGAYGRVVGESCKCGETRRVPASEVRHPLHCKCAECEDGRGDREYHKRRDAEAEER